MSGVKLLPDLLLLIIGIVAFVLYVLTYLMGVNDRTLLVFSLMCIFFGFITFIMLKRSLMSEESNEIVENSDD